MNINIDWNWQNITLICVAALDLLIFILTLIKRGKKVKLNFKDILELVPGFIAYAEQLIGPGKGSLKLQFVLDQIKTKMTELGYSSNDFLKYDFASYIESILNTPEKKKGEDFDEKI